MLHQNKVKIEICGKEYALQTDEQPSYVERLAVRLDRRIRKMMEDNEALPVTSAAILVGLSLMDDSSRTISDMDNIRGEIRHYVEEAEKAREEIEVLRRRLEKSERRVEELETELGLQQLRLKID